MFKNAEKISKAIDILMKVTEDLEREDRKQEMVSVIHDLSGVHQNVLGDLRGIGNEEGGNFNTNRNDYDGMR